MIDPEDVTLLPIQLDDKYNQDGDGEHPVFTRRAWRCVVIRQDTIVGYWEWVACKLHEAAATDTEGAPSD